MHSKSRILHSLQSDQFPSINSVQQHSYPHQSYSNTKIKSSHLFDVKESQIRNVWAYNFEQEMKKLITLCQSRYHLISLDTEFPGVCVSINNKFDSANNFCKLYENKNPLSKLGLHLNLSSNEIDTNFQMIRENCQQTKLIQIGITICDQYGNIPQQVCTWQINLNFSVEEELISEASLILLQNSNIPFKQMSKWGVKYDIFAQYFFGSDLMMNPDIKWIVFHGAYDLTYLLKLANFWQQSLTKNFIEFQTILYQYFPYVYDLKLIISNNFELCDYGLSKLADKFECVRVGQQHQAGSDSLLTLQCLFKLLGQNQLKNVKTGVYGLSGSLSKKRKKSSHQYVNENYLMKNIYYDTDTCSNYQPSIYDQWMIGNPHQNNYLTENLNCFVQSNTPLYSYFNSFTYLHREQHN